MSKKNIFFVLCCFVFLFLISPISADEYHNQEVLVGEKAAGLGGAFVAVGDGAEACYYNPAGLTQLKISYISVSAQILEIRETKGKFIGDFTGKRTSLSFIPSFWGIAKDMGEYKFGFSIIVPDYDASKMHEQYSDWVIGNSVLKSSRIDEVNNNQTYLIGPSIAKEITPKFSLGATAYFCYKDIYQRNTYYFHAEDNNSVVKIESNVENSGKGLGGIGVFGLFYKPFEKLNLGLSYKISSNIKNTVDLIERSYLYNSILGSPFTNSYSEEQVKYNSVIPSSVIGGLKWQPSERLTLAMDVSYYFPADYTKKVDEIVNTTTNETTFVADKTILEEVVNINIGTEYMLDNNVPFRFGFYTDRSMAPKLEDNNTVQDEHIDNYGISISTGLLSKNSTMVFGFKYGWGSGRMTNLSFIDNNGTLVLVRNVAEVKNTNYAFNLSGSYNF